MNILNPGQDFDELPESYVIFITVCDSLGYGLPIYHIDREIRENSRDFPDGSHIVYVNSSKQEDTELGRLMHDFHCKSADEMYSQVLAERVRELKETREGVDSMCREMEQIYKEGIEEGMEKGIEKGAMKKAKEASFILADMGLPLEQIARAFHVDVPLIQEWITENISAAK